MHSEKTLEKPSYEVYDSIDTLPYWNWNKVHDTGNLSYLKILKSYRKLDRDDSEEMSELFYDLYEEFYQEIGFTDKYMEQLDLKVHIAKMKNQYLLSGSKVILNRIKVAEKDLELMKEKKENDFRKNVQVIEKKMGIKLNIRKLTVADYYSYTRNI